VLKDADFDETIESGLERSPVIQMDMASLLAEAEDTSRPTELAQSS
jgi:hypothetical protein